MNKKSAEEWLVKSWHHLSTAKLLFEVEHYTDIIAVEIHYASEIALKSFLAYDNVKIIKTHELLELSKYIKAYMTFDEEELDILDVISEYHIGESYPTPHRELPSREEIKEVLDFTEKLFEQVCYILDIDKKKLI